ncbi:MAG: site-2 protease family protein [Kiritimatiellae bacterium]|nr:site-2 protease family protein [Kiritimatiellia bacterium]
MEILVTIVYIAVCVLLFALAILIHEFGHFVVALRLGLRVEAFSIGFGKAIWKKKVNGVEYRLSWIPLGGYVSIPDVDPEGTKALEGGGAADAAARARIPAWKEILVAVAGPAMNLVLAAALAVGLSLVPQARFGELPAEIGDVLPGGPAAEGGLKKGDVVRSVGGRQVRTWSEMQTEVQIAGGRPVEFDVGRKLTITPKRDEVTGAWYIMAMSVSNATGAVAWMPSRNPLRQLAWDAGSIFRVLKGLVTPKEAKATSQALGGPIMIAEGLYRQVRRNSWDGIGFLRFLNVNLAVLNLLPVPVLDGGLIMFALFALVFRRRVPDAVVKYLSLTFMTLLIALMGLLIYRDGRRTYRIHTFKPDAAEAARTDGGGTNVHERADSGAESR